MTRPLRGAKIFAPLLLLGVLFFLLQILPGPAPHPAFQQGPVSVGNRTTLTKAYYRWRANTARQEDRERLRLYLAAPAASHGGSVEGGRADIDFETGQLRLVLLDVPQTGSYELWALGPAGDGNPSAARDAVLLGTLDVQTEPAGAVFDLSDALRRGARIDRLVLTAQGGDPYQDAVLVGSPSLFEKMFYAEERARYGPVEAVPSGPGEALLAAARPWFSLVPEPAFAASAESPELDSLIAVGESLFVFGLFDGNGRTCATCHPPLHNFTIDTTFIQSLPPSDPLFVAEFDTALAQLENPFLMRHFALILENVDGFEDPTNKFVMRGVPHTLGMSHTIAAFDTSVAPKDRVGWGGDGAPNDGRLRDFATGAVRQHFTKSLNRVPDVDFKLPTSEELDALEAFQLSLGRPDDLNLGTLQLTSTVADSGRKLFIQVDSEGGTKVAGKCDLCHINGGGTSIFFGGNDNFDTGIANRVHPAQLTGEPMPKDGGFGKTFNPSLNAFGNGEFNTPSVIESADTPPFFHNGIDGTLANMVSFYSTPVFNNSPAGQLLKAIDSGGQGINVTPTELVAFLRVINVLENLRSTVDAQTRAIDCPDSASAAKLADFARTELEDAMQVLTAGGLHPAAMPHLVSADSLNDLAIAEPDWTERSVLLGWAIHHENTARNMMVVGGVVDVPGTEVRLTGLDLAPGYPNPFVSSTVITFTMPRAGPVRLSVYDVRGRLVKHLVRGVREAGPQSIRWDGRTETGTVAPSGSYFLRLDAFGSYRVQNIVRLR